MFSLAQHVSVERPRVLRFPRLHLHFTVSHLWRLLIVGLMISLYTIGMWSGLLAQAHAYAASLYHLPYVSSSASNSSSANNCVLHPLGATSSQLAAATSSLSDHEKSVGEQAYFTLMKWKVNDHLRVGVNVASGNLVVHASDLHIQGRGIDL